MKYVLIISILLIGNFIYCQHSSILNLRYDEDYSLLKYDSSRNWYKNIKYIQLYNSTQSFISLGGEYRYQIQYIKNEDWGDASEKENSFVFNRLLFHGDLHFNKRIRVFGQVSSTTASKRGSDISPVDENLLDVQQLFTDITILKNEKNNLKVRVGRQEFLYGSQRLISVREGPNNRLSFDAIKVFFQKQNFQVDFLYSFPVRIQNGVFDDPINHNEKLWSIYLVKNKLNIIQNADLYYIGFVNKRSLFTTTPSKENRHSFGLRIWKYDPPFTYDLEGVYQFGKIGPAIINAYTASANIAYQFDKLIFSPTVRFKTEAISGDYSVADQEINTFNPLFPRGAYFGLAALIGPVNLIDFHPSVELELHPKILFSADYDMFWRFSSNDGIYRSNATLLYPKAINKHIGNQLGLSIEYTPVQYLEISPELTWFQTGKYLKEVSSGKDILFTALTIHLKF